VLDDSGIVLLAKVLLEMPLVLAVASASRLIPYPPLCFADNVPLRSKKKPTTSRRDLAELYRRFLDELDELHA
jgi:hypothetical protein